VSVRPVTRHILEQQHKLHNFLEQSEGEKSVLMTSGSKRKGGIKTNHEIMHKILGCDSTVMFWKEYSTAGEI